MKRNLSLAVMATSGMAMTSRGQLLVINIKHPTDRPEAGKENLDQTADRGINAMHDPGSHVYHFTLGSVQPAEDAHVRNDVAARSSRRQAGRDRADQAAQRTARHPEPRRRRRISSTRSFATLRMT